MSDLTEQARMAVRRGRKKHPSLEKAIDRLTSDGEQAEDAEFEEVPKEDPFIAEEAIAIREEEARQQELAPYQDGLPFDLDRIKWRIVDCATDMLEKSITIGKYLIWVKEEVGHGKFLEWADSELGMSRFRTAECMRIAQRMIGSKCASARTFIRAIAGGSKMKALALIDVTDEEIQDAMDTETFLGRDIDEVSAMSYRQLQEALREDRGQLGDVKKERDDLKWKLKKAEAALDEAKNKTDDPINPKDPPSILGRHFSAVIAVLGKLETVAIEFADEVDDAGLMVPETRDMISSYIGTFNQKITHLYQILTPNEIRDVRLHILPAPKPPEEKDAE